MTEKKTPPKPTIRNTPPVKPPVTSVDVPEPVTPEVEEEEVPDEEPVSAINRVETDLVKRFIGAAIDGVIALTISVLVGVITGSDLLQYLAWAAAILVKDSLPALEGQSVGKKLVKTKAVKEDGSSLEGDWIAGATRNVLLALPLLGLVECFIILTRSGNSEAGLRLGDQWAETKVISVE